MRPSLCDTKIQAKHGHTDFQQAIPSTLLRLLINNFTKNDTTKLCGIHAYKQMDKQVNRQDNKYRGSRSCCGLKEQRQGPDIIINDKIKKLK